MAGPIESIRRMRDDAAAAAKRRQERAQERVDLERIMDEAWGRRFIWRQLERAGVFRSSFTGEAISMAFREGERNVGLKLLADIHELCPGRYEVMMKENA